MSDYWFEQRYEDAIWVAREKEGRCGNCGAFKGEDHRCPQINQE